MKTETSFGKLTTLFIQGIIIFLLMISCASAKTQLSQYVGSVPLVRDGEYRQAAEIIENSKETKYKEKDRVLYYLDLGMLLHWAGEYEASNELLSNAEQAIEELFTKSVSKGIASAVLNDNALDYSGEDYEDIYLNVFKCLNYISLGDREAAQVEVRRVQIKLNILEDKYKKLIEEYNASEDSEGQLEARENRFHNDVLARYLSLLLYRAEGAEDDARIDLETIDEAWDTQAHLYDFKKPALPVLRYPEEEKALVNVLSFSGLSPIKLADTIFLSGGAGIMHVRMDDQDEAHADDVIGFHSIAVSQATGGIHFKMQFPRLTSRSSSADRIIVKFDGKTMAKLSLLEDIEKIARDTFLLKQPLTIGRTIIRATVKNVVKEIGKAAIAEGLSDQGVGGAVMSFLLGSAADLAVDSTENADLRISQFFPSSAKIAEIAVDPGSYHVTVEYWEGQTLLGTTDHGIREFAQNDLNLIESYILK